MKHNEENKGYYSSLSGVGKAVPIILGAIAVFITVCLIAGDSGALGKSVLGLLGGLFSLGAYIIPIALVIHAICFAADVALGKLKQRIIFSTITILSVSSIEYAISLWGEKLVFAPVQYYTDATCGGFVGSILGFVFGALIGNLGGISSLQSANGI